MGIFNDRHQIQWWSFGTTVLTGTNGKAGGVHAGQSLRSQSHDDALRVQEACVVQITVNHGKIPPGLGKFWPEDGGHRSATLQEVVCVAAIGGVSGKGQMIIRGEPVLQEMEHSHLNLCVIEKLQLGKVIEEFRMQPFPAQIARAIEPDGRTQVILQGIGFQQREFRSQAFDEKLRVFQVERCPTVACVGMCLKGHPTTRMAKT